MNTYRFVDRNLSHFLSELELSDSAIAIDTEFVRFDSYYAKLGLIQINYDNKPSLIDPVLLKDLSGLHSLFIQNRPFIFHACGEDIEIINHQFGVIPKNIIDTQILAAFLDNPLTASYVFLLEKYLKITIEKSETRTDWLARPLSEKQCSYAIDDVLYLNELAEKLMAEVKQKGWGDAAKQETNTFIRRRTKLQQPTECYRDFKSAWSLNSVQLSYLKLLACWRLEKAKADDIAINFVIKEDTLLQLAKYQPKSVTELTKFDISSKQIRLYGDEILSMLKLDVEPTPTIIRINQYPDYKLWIKKIKNEAMKQAQKCELNPSLLISKRIMNEFIEWNHNPSEQLPELISGWRASLFSVFA